VLLMRLGTTNIIYSEHEIKSGGSNIVLSVWEPPAPEAAIVFIPATMVHPLFYEALLSGFAERGYAVVGVHPVGHGKSPRNIKRYTISDIVRNGVDGAAFALERYSLPIMTMGSNQGGVVAAAIAAEDERIAAVFAHNIMLSELPDSVGVSRFPKCLRYVYIPVKGIFSLLARLWPDLELPLEFYLERSRIGTDPAMWETVEEDSLCLTHYSMHFLASLFTTRFPGLTDGSLRCPVYLIADSGDKLFTAAYTKKVFERLKAPHKEMVEFHFNDHMLMVTHPTEVCDTLAGIMHRHVEGGNTSAR
jgi:alpha-beta hydrolase superfamily lysophospholipase